MGCFVLSLMGSTMAWAHHPACHSGPTGINTFNSLTLNSSKPLKFLGLGYDISRLDNELGYLSQIALYGEYSLGKKMAVGGRVPFVLVRDRGLASASSIGDVSINGRYLFAQGKIASASARASTFLDLSFPTGDENDGTGSGTTILSPGLALSLDWESLSIFGALGVSTKVTNSDYTTLNPSVGIKVPLVKEGLSVSALGSIESNVHLNSQSFERGSAKVYLKPALLFGFGPKWWITAGGKISLADTLKLKSGGGLSPASTTLLGDIEAGASIDINRIF